MGIDQEEKVMRAVQTLFRSTPLLLIGSGFSSSYGLPSMKALGEHLLSCVPAHLKSDESRSLWAATETAIQIDLEKGLDTIASGAVGRSEVISAIREETAALIIVRTREAERKILSSPDPNRQAPVRLLKRLYSGAPQNAECVPIITTNYDTLLELFCDLAELPIDTGFAGFRHRRVRSSPVFQTQYRRILTQGRRTASYDHRPCLNVRLIKPHGSITWQLVSGSPMEVLDDLFDTPRTIIVPGPTKYEDALVNVLFDSMRTEMNATVSRANALLCIGFGFNDSHLQGAIRGRLEAGMPTLIIARSFTQKIKDAIATFPHILAVQRQGDGAEIHTEGSVLSSPLPLWELDTFLKAYLE